MHSVYAGKTSELRKVWKKLERRKDPEENVPRLCVRGRAVGLWSQQATSSFSVATKKGCLVSRKLG